MGNPLKNKRLKKGARKALSIAVSVTTTVWLSGVVYLAPVAVVQAADIVDGDLIRNSSAEGAASLDIYIVKIVGDKKFKRLILNPQVFESYGHFDKNGDGDKGWNDVIDVDQATLDQYTTSELVREDGTSEVFRLTAGPGDDTGTKQWLNMTAQEFTDAGYDSDSIYTVNNTDIGNYNSGSDICSGDCPVAEGGTLQVTIADETPGTGLVVDSAQRVIFTILDFKNTSNEDAVVDSVTIKRGGAGNDGAFASVALFDLTGLTEPYEQIGNTQSLNSSHEGTVTEDITIVAGETKKIGLVGNMNDLASYAGNQLILSVSDIVMKNGTLEAILPIGGNNMSAVTTVTIASPTITAGSLNPSSNASPKVGDEDILWSEIKVTNDSTEVIEVQQIRWTQAGSAGTSDLENVDFLVDNSPVTATLTQPKASVYVVTFDPFISISKGKSKTFGIQSDVVDGSSRTIDFDVDKATDIAIKGTEQGYYVSPSSWPNSTQPRFNGTAHTIGTGSLSIAPATLSSTGVAEDDTDLLLGAFDFTARGEVVKVSQIGIQTKIVTTGSATTSDITNITLKDADGNIVAGPLSPTYDFGSGLTSYGSATTTNTFEVPIGTTRYEIYGDLSSDFATDDQISILITPGANITAKGLTTDKTITATPSGVQQSSTLSIKTLSLTVSVSPEPVANSVVAGAKDFHLATFVLDASGSGEDISISHIAVRYQTGTALPSELSNMTLWDGEVGDSAAELTWKGTNPNPSATTPGTGTSTFQLSNNLIVAKDTVKTIKFSANLSSGMSGNDTIKIGLASDGITSKGARSGNTVTETYSGSPDGHTFTVVSSGTLTLSKDGTSPKAALLIDDTADQVVGVLAAQAEYEDVYLKSFYVTVNAVNSGDAGAISLLTLTDGTTDINVTPTSTTQGTFYINVNKQIKIKKDEVTKLTLKVKTGNVDGKNSNATVQSGEGFYLSVGSVGDVVAEGVSSSNTLAAGSKSGTPSFGQFTVYEAVPVIDTDFTQSAMTSNGNYDLFKLTVKADGGQIGLYKLTFSISTTTVTLDGVKLEDSSTQLLGNIEDNFYTYTSDGSGIYEVIFDQESPSCTGETCGEPYWIGANTTQTLILSGTASGYDASSSNGVSTALAGDATWSSTVMAKTATQITDANDDFIWSDNNWGTASSSATITAEWTNGYRVSGMSDTTSSSQSI